MTGLLSPAALDLYRLDKPSVASLSAPLLLDSPHSGTALPADFDFICSTADLRSSTDLLVDQLIAAAADYGATTLCANVSRTYIDLNRALDDLDPALCGDAPPWPLHPTKRTQYGLGLIHELAKGQKIYGAPLSAETLRQRVEHYYRPYYACLDQQLQPLQRQFGCVLHLNMHAMPSRTSDGKVLPDIVIGDLDGTSSHRIWRDTVKDLLQQAGFVVTVNTPYKGVEIIRHTGKPRQGFHALQIEINKALYLDEQTLLPHAGLADCRSVFASIWESLSHILRDTADCRHAAE
jgi:N-formylglutamate deformylase